MTAITDRRWSDPNADRSGSKGYPISSWCGRGLHHNCGRTVTCSCDCHDTSDVSQRAGQEDA